MCLEDNGVVLAEEHEVVLHLTYIIYYGAVDVAFEEATALLEHEVTTAQLVLLAELRELFQEVLSPQELLHSVCRSKGSQLGSVIVGIGEGELADESC